MDKAPCVFCGVESRYQSMFGVAGGHMRIPCYACPQCGHFVLGDRLAMEWNGRKTEDAFKIACLVREKQLADNRVLYGVFEDEFQPTDKNIAKYLKAWWRVSELLAEFPKATAMVDRGLANLARKAQHPMDRIRVTESEIEFLTFCRGFQLTGILEHMKEAGLLGLVEMHSGGMDYSISPTGWTRLEHLEQAGVSSKQGFVAMWFSMARDAYYQQAIKPAIEAAGFSSKRIDAVEHNNKICDEIIAEIRKSRFIVADFTGQRGGVYFEAGYAMGMGLPVIWLVQKEDVDKLHFDTRQYNHIVYDTVEDLKQRLQNRIAVTIHQ